MSKVVIKVEGLSKQFRLGTINTKTFASDYLSKKNKNKELSNEFFWALKDINFEVRQGEVLGVVGKNGAGKSVLLKILSQLTAPTTGTVKIRGRIASLLEVGTGFHQELTGRENVYLNGSILGMSRKEIQRKFDEIVDFSGVEMFIDTPVKRYSSGMKVRLGFAVAAHLEPEILIVDEVLAVGDMEFQKKCLGKMHEVSEHGRTILFVSHNLNAVRDLCTRGILLEKGIMKFEGEIPDVIDQYLLTNDGMAQSGIVSDDFIRNVCTLDAKVRKVILLNMENEAVNTLYFRQPFKIRIEFENLIALEHMLVSVRICTSDSTVIASSDSYSLSGKTYSYSKGTHAVEVTFKDVLLPMGYFITASLATEKGLTVDHVERVYDFHVSRIAEEKETHYRWNQSHGYFEMNGDWKM